MSVFELHRDGDCDPYACLVCAIECDVCGSHMDACACFDNTEDDE